MEQIRRCWMDTEWMKIGDAGEVVIPARFLAALGMKPGDNVMVELDIAEVKIFTRREAVRRIQEQFRTVNPEGVAMVDEFIKERREEIAKETAEIAEAELQQADREHTREKAAQE